MFLWLKAFISPSSVRRLSPEEERQIVREYFGAERIEQVAREREARRSAKT